MKKMGFEKTAIGSWRHDKFHLLYIKDGATWEDCMDLILAFGRKLGRREKQLEIKRAIEFES